MKKAKSLLSLVLAMLIAFGGAVFAFAADEIVETEENNTIVEADILGVGSSIKGKIGSTDDIDVYSLTVSDSGIITITLTHDVKTNADPVATYFKVTAVDAKDEFVDSFTSTGTQKDVTVDFSVIPGVYYIKVESGAVTDSGLEYTLSTKINKSALFEKEPNNMASQATAMTLSKKGDSKLYYGAITAGDVDYYAVTFAKPSLASFGIYNTASKSGNYTASLVKIVDGANGATAEKVIGAITIKDGEEIKDSPLFGINGGTYYLKVEGVGSSTGGYQARVFAGDSNTAAEFEYNNEEKYANVLGVGKNTTAELFDASDVDIFKFEAPKDNKGYEITLVDYDGKKAVANGQWAFEIKDENGKVVKEKVTVLNSETVTAETASLDKGVYFIKVVAGNVFTGETYKLSIVEKKVSTENTEDKDDEITVDEFIEDIKGIDWSGFWKNFEGWFEYINVLGIIKDLMTSVMDFLTTFVFANM